MKTPTKTAALLLAALLAPLAGARALEGEYVGYGCEGMLACGSIETTGDGCVSTGAFLAQGAALDEDTFWEFRVHTWTRANGGQTTYDSDLGSVTAFRAAHGFHVVDGYSYHAVLLADGVVVAETSSTVVCW